MKVTDYKSGFSLTVNQKGKKDEPSYLIFMSNEDESLVSRVDGNSKTEDDEKKMGLFSEMIINLADKVGCSHIAFIDVDSERSIRGAAMFPMHSGDPTEYEFPDPKEMPTYEEVELV